MASVETSKLSKADHDELVCSYAALMLHDDGLEITAEKLSKVIKASGNEVDAYWPALFAKALKSANIDELLTNVVTAGPAAGPAAAAADGGAAPAEEKKEEKKEEAEDVDMGGLFGDEDDYWALSNCIDVNPTKVCYQWQSEKHDSLFGPQILS